MSLVSRSMTWRGASCTILAHQDTLPGVTKSAMRASLVQPTVPSARRPQSSRYFPILEWRTRICPTT